MQTLNNLRMQYQPDLAISAFKFKLRYLLEHHRIWTHAIKGQWSIIYFYRYARLANQFKKDIEYPCSRHPNSRVRMTYRRSRDLGRLYSPIDKRHLIIKTNDKLCRYGIRKGSATILNDVDGSRNHLESLLKSGNQ